MNKLINNKLVWKLGILTGMCLSSVALSACHDAKAEKESSDTAYTATRPDAALKELMRAISESDAPGFAAICIYPIERPYPLKSIEDSVSMVDYFPVIVDDSLKTYISKSKLDDWENYGWRGWSIGDSKPLWFDEGVQIIDYISPAETGLRKILAREEIMSLAPQYREGWTPVMTLIEIDGDKVFRIDSHKDTYRLMGFDKAEKVRDIPSILLIGNVTTEGSAGSPVYAFSDSTGMEAEYLPEAEPPVSIYIRNPKQKKEISFRVRRGYWRDILRSQD